MSSRRIGPRMREAARIVVQNPGITNADLAAALQSSRFTRAAEIVRRTIFAGLVEFRPNPDDVHSGRFVSGRLYPLEENA